MFGPLGFQEILLILAVALLIFGPRELPKIGRTIGRTLAEFRKASNDLRRSLNTELLEEELRANDPRKMVKETVDDLKSIATLEEPETRTPSRPAADAGASVPAAGSEPGRNPGDPPEAEAPGVPATVARGSASTATGS